MFIRCPLLTPIFAELADSTEYFFDIMKLINRDAPSLTKTSQTYLQQPNTLVIWDQMQQVDISEIEVPSQKQLNSKYYEKLSEQVTERLQGQGDKLGMAWLTSSKFKGSGLYLLPKTCIEIPDTQYKALLNMRLLMFPEVNLGLSDSQNQSVMAYQCQHCNQTASDVNSEGYQHFDKSEQGDIDFRFHGLNCKSTGNTKNNRHDYIVDQMIILFQSLKMPCHRETQMQGGNHRVDVTVNLAGEAKFYIDVNVSNPAARSYVTQLQSDTIPYATSKHSEQMKRNKYATVFARQNPPIAMTQFVPFIMETTGRIGQEGETFLEKLKDYSRPEINTEYHINKFKANIRKIIARGNAKCFLEFHRDIKVLFPQVTQAPNQ